MIGPFTAHSEVPPRTEELAACPREAVRETTGAARVAVVNPDGGFDWRPVTLGARTDTTVEIVAGVERGESVVADATALLSGGA